MSSMKNNILAYSDVHKDGAKSDTSEKPGPILVGDSQLLEPNNLTSVKPSKCPRNPIVGIGLRGDGFSHLMHKMPIEREQGNPVTGEGYSPGRTDYERRFHVRPGVYSQGRW